MEQTEVLNPVFVVSTGEQPALNTMSPGNTNLMPVFWPGRNCKPELTLPPFGKSGGFDGEVGAARHGICTPPHKAGRRRLTRQGAVIMRHPGSRELFQYWSRLRGERTAPERADIDPSAIRGILADVFILEADPQRLFPLRLSGSRVNALFGCELKGRAFASLWPAASWGEVAALLEGVMDESHAVVIGLSTTGPDGATLELEWLILPLRHHGKTHARLIGSLSPARVPAWLGLVPVGEIAIRSLRVLSATAASAQAPADERRRQHLTIHEGGRQPQNWPEVSQR